MTEVPKKHGIIYFEPGTLIFHAHGNLKGSNEIDTLMKWANDLASSRGITITTSSTEDVIEFNIQQKLEQKERMAVSAKQVGPPPIVVGPGQEYPPLPSLKYRSPQVKVPPPFSMVFARVSHPSWPAAFPTPPSNEVLDDEMYPESEPVQKHMQAMKELIDLAHFLDKNRKTAPVPLEVVSLNWLNSISKDSQPGGTGGPGGEPRPVSDVDKDKYHLHLASSAALPASFGMVSQAGGGNGVVVALLDTAYEQDELTNIYKNWVTDVPNNPHPIIKTLLGPNGRLTVKNDSEAKNYLPGFRMDGYDYVMKSHGLHGAGTINSLAPEAEIYIYQALNKYGMGNIRIIGNNLARIIQDFAGRPLVVNASLTFRIPQSDADLADNDDYGIGRTILDHRPSFLIRLICWIICWIFEKILHLPCPGFCEFWLDRQARPFEWICDLIYVLNSRLIAAAGNDGKPGHRRPPARYPAASESVVGVGALGSNGSPAPYSNLADRPPRMGITTLGGDSTKGVIGVYVDPFPEGQPNDNGMAQWHGSSIATNVISGTVAAVLGNLIAVGGSTGRVPTTEDAIIELYRAQSLITRDTEDVLQVEQS